MRHIHGVVLFASRPASWRMIDFDVDASDARSSTEIRVSVKVKVRSV